MLSYRNKIQTPTPDKHWAEKILLILPVPRAEKHTKTCACEKLKLSPAEVSPYHNYNEKLSFYDFLTDHERHNNIFYRGQFYCNFIACEI